MTGPVQQLTGSTTGVSYSYSADGITFGNTPVSFSSVRFVKINVTIPPKTQTAFAIPFVAPDDTIAYGVQKTARSETSYTLNGTTYNLGKKKLLLVDDTDSDGDGTIDVFDNDDDGDGIPDSVE